MRILRDAEQGTVSGPLSEVTQMGCAHLVKPKMRMHGYGNICVVGCRRQRGANKDKLRGRGWVWDI